MEIKFRYYFSKESIERWKRSNSDWDRKNFERHRKIILLLQEIKERYGIDYELFEFSSSDEEKIYREHFVSRAKYLSKVLDEKVSKALKSRSGYVYLNGVIAIVKNEQVVWLNKGYWRDLQKWETYDNEVPFTLGFLKCVLYEPDYLAKILKELEIAETKKKSVHEELIEKFISSVEGKVKREVEVGEGFKVYDKYGRLSITGRYKIDLVWETENETYVIEVKEQLNFEAIGQAIVYKELYKKEHPNENVKSGIICKVADRELLEIARKYIDKIWCEEVVEKGTISWFE